MIEKKKYGTTKKGEEVSLFTLKNKKGMEAQVTDFGAILVNLLVPDKNGRKTDVVLGFDTLREYEESPKFYGATVGRVANRIRDGKFTLDGKAYVIQPENVKHLLHSGPDFYNKRMWNAEPHEDEDGASVTFFMQSPDGDQGYPGNLDVEVTYTLTEDNELMIDYYGLSDQTTLFNMTNHSFFNLNGEGSGDMCGHRLSLFCDSYSPADPDCVPLGQPEDVAGTPFDFRTEKTIGQDIRSGSPQIALFGGYDHNFFVNGGKKAEDAELVGRCTGEKSGIVMEIYTDLPGMQIYTTNVDEPAKGKKGHSYGRYSAVCFETQFVPNAVNEPSAVQPVLKAGEEFVTLTVYRFTAE